MKLKNKRMIQRKNYSSFCFAKMYIPHRLFSLDHTERFDRVKPRYKNNILWNLPLKEYLLKIRWNCIANSHCSEVPVLAFSKILPKVGPTWLFSPLLPTELKSNIKARNIFNSKFRILGRFATFDAFIYFKKPKFRKL